MFVATDILYTMPKPQRKRINLSVSPAQFTKLSHYSKKIGCKNECQLVGSLINILLDRLESADNRHIEVEDNEAMYIDSMFNDLACSTRQADGDGGVTITRRNRQ